MKVFRTLLLLALLPLASCVKEGGDDKTKNYIVVDSKVPEFEIKNTIGGGWNGLKSPDDFLGKKTLLVFFTTTCPDCWREMPFIDYAHSQLSNAGLRVVPIGRGETNETVRAYWTKVDPEYNKELFTMPHYIDTDQTVFNLFANRTIPRIYLVNENGIVIWMRIEDLGYGKFTEEKGKQFNALIKDKLKL